MLLNFACSLPREAVTRDVDRIIAELEPKIRSQADAQCKGDISMLKTELQSARRERDRMQALLDDMDTTCTLQRGKLDSTLEELKEFQNAQTINHSRVREECDAKLAESRRIYDESLAQIRKLYEAQLQSKSSELERAS